MSKKKLMLITITAGLIVIFIFSLIKFVMPMFDKSTTLKYEASSQMDMLPTNNNDSKSMIASSFGASETQNTTALNDIKNTSSLKKIIKDANVSIRVKSIDEDFSRINSWVQGNGGYEFSRQANSSGSSKNIVAVFKVPPEKLDSFLDFLATVGSLQNTNISSNDITDEYYDTAARLQNSKNGRDQLLEVMKKAYSVEDILRVNSELNRITGEIEVLEGKIKMWDKLVAESTVSLNIFEESKPVSTSQEISWSFASSSDIWRAMKNGFIFTTNIVFKTVVWLFIAVVALLPAIIIIGVVCLIVKFIKKRKR